MIGEALGFDLLSPMMYRARGIRNPDPQDARCTRIHGSTRCGLAEIGRQAEAVLVEPFCSFYGLRLWALRRSCGDSNSQEPVPLFAFDSDVEGQQKSLDSCRL